MTQTYTILKKYGEAADTTEIREAGFQWVLEDYTIEDITEAFKQYLKTGKEIPTPADIVEILDPSVKPLCPKVYQRYINLARDGGEFALVSYEKDYIHQYEQQQLRRLK